MEVFINLGGKFKYTDNKAVYRAASDTLGLIINEINNNFNFLILFHAARQFSAIQQIRLKSNISVFGSIWLIFPG